MCKQAVLVVLLITLTVMTACNLKPQSDSERTTEATRNLDAYAEQLCRPMGDLGLHIREVNVKYMVGNHPMDEALASMRELADAYQEAADLVEGIDSVPSAAKTWHQALVAHLNHAVTGLQRLGVGSGTIEPMPDTPSDLAAAIVEKCGEGADFDIYAAALAGEADWQVILTQWVGEEQ